MFFQRKPLRIAIIQNISCDYKKNVKHDKNHKLIYFIVSVEASKVNEFFKTLACVTPIHFETLLCNNNVIFGL